MEGEKFVADNYFAEDIKIYFEQSTNPAETEDASEEITESENVENNEKYI